MVVIKSKNIKSLEDFKNNIRKLYKGFAPSLGYVNLFFFLKK